MLREQISNDRVQPEPSPVETPAVEIDFEPMPESGNTVKNGDVFEIGPDLLEIQERTRGMKWVLFWLLVLSALAICIAMLVGVLPRLEWLVLLLCIGLSTCAICPPISAFAHWICIDRRSQRMTIRKRTLWWPHAPASYAFSDIAGVQLGFAGRRVVFKTKDRLGSLLDRWIGWRPKRRHMRRGSNVLNAIGVLAQLVIGHFFGALMSLVSWSSGRSLRKTIRISQYQLILILRAGNESRVLIATGVNGALLRTDGRQLAKFMNVPLVDRIPADK